MDSRKKSKRGPRKKEKQSPGILSPKIRQRGSREEEEEGITIGEEDKMAA